MIIAIDGLDGSGKETTCNMLSDWLTKNGYTNMVHSFPDYDTPSGLYIKRLISTPEIIQDMPAQFKRYHMANLFAYNRKEHFDKVYPIMDDYDIHIFDRYWASNILYQGLGLSMDELIQFSIWCRSLDTALLNPMPDTYYFLQIPYAELRKRIDTRKHKEIINDSYEKDEYQKAVYHLSESIIHNKDFSFIYDKVFSLYTLISCGRIVSYDAEKVLDIIVEYITRVHLLPNGREPK